MGYTCIDVRNDVFVVVYMSLNVLKQILSWLVYLFFFFKYLCDKINLLKGKCAILDLELKSS